MENTPRPNLVGSPNMDFQSSVRQRTTHVLEQILTINTSLTVIAVAVELQGQAIPHALQMYTYLSDSLHPMVLGI